MDCSQPDADECIFSLEKLKPNGNWGLFVTIKIFLFYVLRKIFQKKSILKHELGHNLQRDQWTFEGSVEVTVNLFSMHACEFVIGNKIIHQKWLVVRVKLI